MEEKKLVPKLRFPGFTEPWEQRKLGETATVEMNKRIFKEQTSSEGEVPFYKIGTFGGVADSYISRDLYEEYKKKYPYPNSGDILISASGSIGRTVVYNGEEAYFQDSNIVWLNHEGRINNSFLLQFYNVVKWSGLEGSTIKRLYNKNILETPILLPKLEEQQLIGGFLKLMDDNITLHQRKLEHLKLKKKSLLQKLFPKEGEVYPELRFPGFTAPWEQRKLGDVVKRESVTQVSSTEYPAIEYEDVIPETGQLNKDIYKKGVQKVGILFDANKVLYGKLRPYLHNWVAPMYTGVAVGDWWVLNPCGLDRGFLYTLIQTVKFDTIANQSAGSKMPRADWKLLSTTEFSIPSLDEQIKIGKLVEGLNDYITLHQRKLEHLQLLKKALLQQLFV